MKTKEKQKIIEKQMKAMETIKKNVKQCKAMKNK